MYIVNIQIHIFLLRTYFIRLMVVDINYLQEEEKIEGMETKLLVII